MTIQEAKDRVAEIRSYKDDYVEADATRVLCQDFVTSIAAGSCKNPQAVAKIIDDL